MTPLSLPGTLRLFRKVDSPEGKTARRGDDVAPDATVSAGETSAALDQWRGLALVFVLISHGFYFTEKVHGLGRVGVNLFFFISGILVFRSLSRPRAGSGWDSANSYWRRRLRRLYPALMAYVILVIPVNYALQGLAEPQLGPDSQSFYRALPFALTYLMNYSHLQAMALAHLWSLSCEMQFYLLAPLIFLAGGRGSLGRVLVWGIILSGLVGLGFSVGQSGGVGPEKFHFEFAVWPMMLGFFCESKKAWLQRTPAWLVAPAAIAALLVFAACSVGMIAGQEMKKLVIASGAFMVIPCLFSYLNGRTVPGRPGRLLAWLGMRTYSIYLWQQPLTICYYLPALWHPLGAVLAVFVGAASFHFFERPFLCSARRNEPRLRLAALQAPPGDFALTLPKSAESP